MFQQGVIAKMSAHHIAYSSGKDSHLRRQDRYPVLIAVLFLMFLTASTCSGADVPLRKWSRNLQTIVVAVKWAQFREVKG